MNMSLADQTIVWHSEPGLSGSVTSVQGGSIPPNLFELLHYKRNIDWKVNGGSSVFLNLIKPPYDTVNQVCQGSVTRVRGGSTLPNLLQPLGWKVISCIK